MRKIFLASLAVLLTSVPGLIPKVSVNRAARDATTGTTVTVSSGGEARAWNLLEECCASGHEMCCAIYMYGNEQGWWND